MSSQSSQTGKVAGRRGPTTASTPKSKTRDLPCMAGGPSHLETLDYKPKLAEMDGKPMPESITRGQPIAQLQGQTSMPCASTSIPVLQKRPKRCSLFKHIGGVADELCIIRSFHTEQINHDPAHTFVNTGSSVSAGPAWAPGFFTAWVVRRKTSRDLLS